jgi:hypothetical protein
MRTSPIPIYSNGLITPQSIGYSYMPASVMTSAFQPAPISTFGTSHSPNNVGASRAQPLPVRGGNILKGLFG